MKGWDVCVWNLLYYRSVPTPLSFIAINVVFFLIAVTVSVFAVAAQCRYHCRSSPLEFPFTITALTY